MHMDSTYIALTPELEARLAMGHDESGKPSPPWKLQAYSPAGDVHSTANDLLKYASANAGLAPSSLTPLMKETHVIRFKDSRGLSGESQVSVSLDVPPWIGWTGERINRPGWNSSATLASPAVIMRGLASTKSNAGAWWC